MTTSDIKKFIQSIEIFKSFSDAFINKLLEIIQSGKLECGELLFEEGESAQDIYIIAEGEVLITKSVTSEIEKTLSVIGTKGIFGEMGLFSNLTRSANAKAKTDVHFYKINCQSFKDIFHIDPQGSQKFVELLLLSTMERLEHTSRELATIYEISKIITKHHSMKEFCSNILRQLCFSVPHINTGIIYLWNEFAEEYEPYAQENVQDMLSSLSKSQAIIQSLQENMYNGTLETMILYGDQIKALLGTLFVSDNMIVAPLVKANFLKGAILLYNKQGKVQHRSSVIDLLNSIANLVVEAIDNIKQKEDDQARERLKRGGAAMRW